MILLTICETRKNEDFFEEQILLGNKDMSLQSNSR